MKWLKKAKVLMGKIHWKKTIGIDPNNTKSFACDFVSNPLTEEQFDLIAGKYLKKIFGKEKQSFEVGYKYSMPAVVLLDSQKQLTMGLPKLTVSNRKILYKQVVGIMFELTSKGWIITQEVQGILE